MDKELAKFLLQCWIGQTEVLPSGWMEWFKTVIPSKQFPKILGYYDVSLDELYPL